MRVQFVYPNAYRYPRDISIGIAYLSSFLKEHGHETALIDTTIGMKDAEILSRAKKFNPDLLAISAVSNNFSYAIHVATHLKKENKIPVIVGGVHATIDPEETLMKECVDMVCIGEGEDTLLELVRSMEKGEKNTAIQNIWFKENGRIIKNDLRPLRENLDAIPYPDLSIYDYPRYLKHRNSTASFHAHRGCPYHCSYCINHTLQNIYKGLGQFVRYRSADTIIDEMKRVVQDFSVREVNIFDDTFTLNKKRVKEFCKKYKKEIGLPFNVNGRINNISEELLQDLSESGCIRVLIGLESGDPFIRNEVLKKNLTDEQIIDGCRLIKKFGIGLYTFNMIGIPGETMQSIKKTIALNRRIRPNFLVASIFTAYKGTELYEKCKKEGLLKETIQSSGSYYTNSNVRHPSFSIRKLRFIHKWFGFYVFITYDIKRAFIYLFDRYLRTNRFYIRLRASLMKRFLNSKALEKFS